ncbi:hypothetical protein M5D96_009190 [Drosophila gunungcola]|uniref:Uncharacterized protein n=1 Tax=Drosophila gunungcola TaxID=103775 RepID=A0A9Q0BNN7_9MUSC|nr:hypothetical protein M5D96_009190 [Drosophila gunungcola]
MDNVPCLRKIWTLCKIQQTKEAHGHQQQASGKLSDQQQSQVISGRGSQASQGSYNKLVEIRISGFGLNRV